MTAEEVRDLGYLSWRDPMAWMETMKGKRWETLIEKEKQHFHKLSNQRHVLSVARQMEKELEDVCQYANLYGFKIGGGTIDILITPTSRFQWKWIWSKKMIPAYDIDVQGNIVWYITSNEDEHYKNAMYCEDSTGKIIWKKSDVYSQVAVINESCYYIKTVDYFHSVQLCVCNAQTGKNERVLFDEKNGERYLSLVKGANRTLYLKSSDPLTSDLYRIDGITVTSLYPKSSAQWALGESIYGDECVMTYDRKEQEWTPHGKPIESWKFPKEEIIWMNLQTGHIITIHEGSYTLWYCQENKAAKVLCKVRIGSIDPNIWSAWENSMIQSFIIRTPEREPYIIHATNHTIEEEKTIIQIKRPIEFKPLESHRFHTISKDGTSVPYVMILEKGIKPKGLFVYVYGAYGSTTPIHWPYQTWYPLLVRGWVISFAMVRGGGDSDLAWADAARRENRHVSVDDFEAVIRASQSKSKCGPEKTVIYGRSAGGLPVGAIVSRYPNGDLMGAAFTEVPYVDVLRTSSNPDLPLTVGEYKEFGNPIEKILNFKELMQVSPINTVPAGGAPGVFVMSHVGLLDKQVFAYESFKWIQRLRGSEYPDSSKPKMKYVTFERKEAHQYRPKRLPRFRAIDFAILDSWVDEKIDLE